MNILFVSLRFLVNIAMNNKKPMYSLMYYYSNLLTSFCRGKFVMISEVLTFHGRN